MTTSCATCSREERETTPIYSTHNCSQDCCPAGLGSALNRPGDLAAGLLWSVSLYFCSPLQLLLLFLGRIETERPSDWVLRQLGRLTKQPCVSSSCAFLLADSSSYNSEHTAQKPASVSIPPSGDEEWL